MNHFAPASVLLLTFSGAVLAAENPPTNDPKENPATVKSIGMARMLVDGTILVGVPGPGSGDHAQAVLVLKPGDTQYQPLLDHVGGLKPGETKSIPPWPDPPSPSRLNEPER
jgi:hypothetical protein